MKSQGDAGMKLKDLQEYDGPDKVVTSFDLDTILKESSESVLQVKAKLPGLDRYIDGFEGGELVAISGPRKGGKTLLAQSLTVYFLEQKVKSLWFSYELTARQFLRSFGDNLPMFLMPLKLKAYALAWMKERILEALIKYGVGVVFIDHLHFLFDIARSRSPSLEIGQVVRFLKGIAIDCNLVIFLLCHMRKTSFDKEPDDSDVRDSSLVSSESDTGLMLWRIKNTDNKACLKVCYSRRTGAFDRKIKLAKINGLLREVKDE
jgi:replicative DNA helicase